MRFPGLFLLAIIAQVSLVTGDALQIWSDIAARSSANVIKLDEQTFDQLITNDRNYTAIGIHSLKSASNC